jgi:hypothetical protein
MIRSAPRALQQCNEPVGVTKGAQILGSAAINCPTKASECGDVAAATSPHSDVF